VSACGFAVTSANHSPNHDILYIMLKTAVADVASSTESISKSIAYVTIAGSIYTGDIVIGALRRGTHDLRAKQRLSKNTSHSSTAGGVV